jgi:phage terminase large subunit-like protein
VNSAEPSGAYEYAKWCVRRGNNKVGKYVKKQAAAWLDIADGKSAEAYVDMAALEKHVKLLGKIQHPDLGAPLSECLEPYTRLLLTAVFCTMTKNDPPTRRYYETAVLEIGRKNYKTFTTAIIFILLMLTEKRFARLYSVAPDYALASEIKHNIQKLLEASPDLYRPDDPAESLFRIMRSEVRCNLTQNNFFPLAYSRDRMDSREANVFLADEAGALDEYPVEAMRSSQISLVSKLGIIISTQYPNDDNVMIDETDICKKTLDGLMPDERRFSLLYEPDETLVKGDTWMKDDRILWQANPVAVTNERIMANLRKSRTKAALYENKRENFLCKHCNIKYKGIGTEGYIDITNVRECRVSEDLSAATGRRVFVGVDLSLSDDNTAVAATWLGDDDLVYSKVWGFVPQDKIERKTDKEKVNYRKLIDGGYCIPCGGEVIDYGVIEKFVAALPETLGAEVVQIGYDRWNAISSVQKWEALGFECVEIKQHSSVLHSPTKLLRELILEKRYRYAENLLLEINFQNAKCTEDTNKNKYVNKKHSSGKVDMVVAIINSMYLLEQSMLYDDDFAVQAM